MATINDIETQIADLAQRYEKASQALRDDNEIRPELKTERLAKLRSEFEWDRQQLRNQRVDEVAATRERLVTAALDFGRAAATVDRALLEGPYYDAVASATAALTAERSDGLRKWLQAAKMRGALLHRLAGLDVAWQNGLWNVLRDYGDAPYRALIAHEEMYGGLAGNQQRMGNNVRLSEGMPTERVASPRR